MIITQFQHLSIEEKKRLLFECCGSTSWVSKMIHMSPAKDLYEFLNNAEEKWYECSEADWKEAFRHHPKIGDVETLRKKFSYDRFVSSEQSSVKEASEQTLEQLAYANKIYEGKYGYIFIVCATGKSAEEMLEILNGRLTNDPEVEIKAAMEEQKKITALRLQKLFTI